MKEKTKLHQINASALALFAATALLRSQTAPVAFDWFEYSGRNA